MGLWCLNAAPVTALAFGHGEITSALGWVRFFWVRRAGPAAGRGSEGGAREERSSDGAGLGQLANGA